ncbi:MAG: radical SAM protein [Rhodobacterales bacterium]|nr:radical SAM protein [Rhodobacterales bacterium]
MPWCRTRCPYCAFYVEPDRGDVAWQRFIDAVHREYALRRPLLEGPAATLSLGGGTPSRMPAELLTPLLSPFDVLPGGEISVEMNPDDVEQGWLAAAKIAGVTRVSLGIQTFNPDFAHLLNRAHTVHQAHQVVQQVRSLGCRTWSIDLMFALPGQSLNDLALDLDAVLAEDPPHVSLYGLTYEPGTAFYRARAAGKLPQPPDHLWRDMYDLLVERLDRAGLYRYEVSNSARPGHESAHNQGYWSDTPYLGLGPGAHGYAPDGRRWMNIADAAVYLSSADPTLHWDEPTPLSTATDHLVGGMRGIHGVHLERLKTRTGLHIKPSLLRGLIDGGMIAEKGARIHLTNDGFPIADAVVRKLVDGLAGGGPVMG